MSAPALGQIVDLSAGASTLYGSEGASVAIHSSNSDTVIGGGFINGHLGFGLSSTAPFRGGLLTSGEQQLSMDLPTDIFGGGPTLLGTGVGYRSTSSNSHQIRGFVGMSSTQGGTPLFQSSRLQTPALYAQIKQPITGTLTTLSTALFSTKTGIALLESLAWNAARPVSLAFTAGVGAGKPYAAASAAVKTRKLKVDASYILAAESFQRGTDPNQPVTEPVRENAGIEYQPAHGLSVSGLHRNYVTPTSSDGNTGDNGLHSAGSVRSALEEVAVQYHRRPTVLSFSVLSSRAKQQILDGTAGRQSSNIGLSGGFDHHVGSFEWNEHFYATHNDRGTRDVFLVSGVTANVNPHLRLTESITNSANGPTFAHGGSLVTQFSSIEVDYQILYLAARPDHPFQQAMVFDSKIQVYRNLWLQATSSIGPTGATLYTLRVGKQFSHASSDIATVAPSAVGENLIHGQVVNEDGKPIEGAALKIDTTEIYTDSKGSFSFREKTVHSHTLTVALDDFLELESFAVVKAPTSVRSAPGSNALPVIIVVRQVINAVEQHDAEAGEAKGTRRRLPIPDEEP